MEVPLVDTSKKNNGGKVPVNYRKTSAELRKAWFEFYRQSGPLERVYLVSFAAGYNAALATMEQTGQNNQEVE
jgi:hypothetical protein